MILNLTKKTTIANNFRYDYLTKIFGLIGKNKPENVVFKTRFGIHTFLLRFPIDVIILDNHFRVIDLKNKLAPNRIFFWNPSHSLVIELPFGTIEKTKTQKGDLFKLSL